MTLSRALVFSLLLHCAAGVVLLRPVPLNPAGLPVQESILVAALVLASQQASTAEVVSPSGHQVTDVSASGKILRTPATSANTGAGRRAVQASPAPFSPPVTPAPTESVAQDDILQYRVNLAREMRRLPHESDMSHVGVVTLLVSTVAGQSEMAVALSQGSGDPVADRLALAWLREAVRSAAVPPGLRGRAFAISVAVRVGSAGE